MVLHNSMSRKKEPFVPRRDDGKVSMYVCGVTVYDYSHIGHARVYVAFDVLYRQLMRQGYDVTYCRNFTDVDDKIIARANENGETCESLVDRFIDAFHEDVASLGCLPPTMEPRATEHIGDIVEMTERLIAKGHAYPTGDGDVYFSVDSLPGYGSLSGRKLEDNRAGERVAVDDRKKNAADFALWKAAKPGEPTWDSPWGAGRPGWHIECSAMIEKMLGASIDIHGGGQDLVFPHHENELAQSTAACGCGTNDCAEPFVKYWVHNGFVKVDSEKMSKSLGNFFNDSGGDGQVPSHGASVDAPRDTLPRPDQLHPTRARRSLRPPILPVSDPGRRQSRGDRGGGGGGGRNAQTADGNRRRGDTARRRRSRRRRRRARGRSQHPARRRVPLRPTEDPQRSDVDEEGQKKRRGATSRSPTSSSRWRMRSTPSDYRRTRRMARRSSIDCGI